MNTQKVLLAGATGYLGHFLVKELKNRGFWVGVLIRKEAQKKWCDVDDIFIAEITKSKTLNSVRQNIDWMFSTVGITCLKDGLTYMDVGYQESSNLLKEALKDQVEAFQYISAINGDKLRQLKIFEAKEKFVDELKASAVRSRIIHPNGFFSDMKDFLNMAKSVEESVGGLEVFTQNEIGELALKARKKPMKISHLPDWVRKGVIWFLRTFLSSYGPIEFFFNHHGKGQRCQYIRHASP